MAHSRFEYVKKFELDDTLLPGTFIVVRVDGRGFSRFTAEHGYTKPNDVRGLAVMNAAATAVLREWGDVILAYGHSDEYSFVFPRDATTFGRRSAKLATGIVSLFAASFVLEWPRHFPPDMPLRFPPAFDARCVMYPSIQTVVDYVKWRQVDCYINSMYNEVFWALVQRGGASPDAAHAELKGTLAEHKNEIMFTRFGINFAKIPVMYRRGTTLMRVRPTCGRLAPEAGGGVRAGKGAKRSTAGGAGGDSNSVVGGGVAAPKVAAVTSGHDGGVAPPTPGSGELVPPRATLDGSAAVSGDELLAAVATPSATVGTGGAVMVVGSDGVRMVGGEGEATDAKQAAALSLLRASDPDDVPLDAGVGHIPPAVVKTVVQVYPDFNRKVDLAAFFHAVG